MTLFNQLTIPHKGIVLCCIFLCSFYPISSFQKGDVPEFIIFGGIQLHLNKMAQSQIQDQVNFLSKSKKQIEQNLYEITGYFTIIEHILEEEGLPKDLKYLAIQENKLTQKNWTQSTEGFWKIKAKLAKEMGIVINDVVDERYHIIHSTLCTARYLRRNNLYFKNWLFVTLSLEMGFDEAKNFVLQNYKRTDFVGVQTLEIDENTHPYIRNLLAYKIFLDKMLSDNSVLQVKLIQYTKSANKTLSHIARRNQVAVEDVVRFNKWLKKKRVPSDKQYPVILFKKNQVKPKSIELEKDTSSLSDEDFYKPKEEELIDNNFEGASIKYTIQEIEQNQADEFVMEEEANNPIYPEKQTTQENTLDIPQSHIVLDGQTLYGIARMYQVSLFELRKLNNLHHTDKIYTGQKLRLRLGENNYSETTPFQNNLQNGEKIHIVGEGESLMTIAKQYQVSVSNLLIWNKLSYEHIIQVGDKLVVEKNPSNKILKSSNTFQTPTKTFERKVLRPKTIQHLSESVQEGVLRGNQPKKKGLPKTQAIRK